MVEGSEWAPTPSSIVKILSKRDGHLDGMAVWHWVFGKIFDERRAAPPAYGRRAWSKVVSYLRFFIRFATLIRVQALPHQTNRSKIQKASLNYVGAVAEQLLWF